MKTAKLGALFLVSVLALAGIGVSYAQWTDSVTINATATTGDLEYRITRFIVTDQSGIGTWHPTWTGIGNYGNEESITVTVAPTYPGWEAICQLTVKNTGNIPLELHSIKLTRTGGNSNLMGYYYYGIPDDTLLSEATIYHLHTFNWWTTERTYDNLGISVTIEPGDTQTLEAYFKLSSNVPQWEGSALTIKLTLTATQAS